MGIGFNPQQVQAAQTQGISPAETTKAAGEAAKTLSGGTPSTLTSGQLNTAKAIGSSINELFSQLADKSLRSISLLADSVSDSLDGLDLSNPEVVAKAKENLSDENKARLDLVMEMRDLSDTSIAKEEKLQELQKSYDDKGTENVPAARTRSLSHSLENAISGIKQRLSAAFSGLHLLGSKTQASSPPVMAAAIRQSVMPDDIKTESPKVESPQVQASTSTQTKAVTKLQNDLKNCAEIEPMAVEAFVDAASDLFDALGGDEAEFQLALKQTARQISDPDVQARFTTLADLATEELPAMAQAVGDENPQAFMHSFQNMFARLPEFGSSPEDKQTAADCMRTVRNSLDEGQKQTFDIYLERADKGMLDSIRPKERSSTEATAPDKASEAPKSRLRSFTDPLKESISELKQEKLKSLSQIGTDAISGSASAVYNQIKEVFNKKGPTKS
jgi:hypothetical protein